MNFSTSEIPSQRWSKFFQQSPFKKYGEKPKTNTTTTDEKIVGTTPKTPTKEESSASQSWLSMTFCGFFSSAKSLSLNKSSSNSQDKEYPEHVSPVTANGLSPAATSNAAKGIITNTNSSAGSLPTSKASKPQEKIQKKASYCSISSNQSHEKDIVPLRQFLRYSMTRSDRRTFQRRRITQPFKPRYEIEWQKDQWLQLDSVTSKQIEQLRKNGFSNIAIRNDKCLKKYIVYDNASDMDVLLELTLQHIVAGKDQKNQTVNEQPEPIVCHQPSQFSVRRTHWWHTSHRVGEADFPSWVDPDLCCKSVMMDARSVMATVTNFGSRRTSLASLQVTAPVSSRFPDTPALSTRSSVNHLRTTSPTYPIKPLKYSEPVLLEELVLSAA